MLRAPKSVSPAAWISAAMVLVIAISAFGAWKLYDRVTTDRVTAYFSETKGLYAGDRVLFLGMPIGAIDSITPEPDRVRVVFHVDDSYRIPAAAKVVIMSPSLVSARSIQLTPAYTGGPTLVDGAVIGLDRTAVPVEWDDFRTQLERLSSALSPGPGRPNGSLGDFVTTARQTFDGRGAQVNETLSELASAISTLDSNRDDIFTTLQGLEKFVTAVSSSRQQIVEFNGRLASVTSLLDSSQGAMSGALVALDRAVDDLTQFLNSNSARISRSVTEVSGLGETLRRSQSDIENLLHTAPTAFANFVNIYQPAQNALTGALAFTNFKNPMQFICSAVQAASQENAADAAKLCIDKLGPFLNRVAISYPPIGANPIVGAQARPTDVDYSEEWLRRLTTSTKRPAGR